MLQLTLALGLLALLFQALALELELLLLLLVLELLEVLRARVQLALHTGVCVLHEALEDLADLAVQEGAHGVAESVLLQNLLVQRVVHLAAHHNRARLRQEAQRAQLPEGFGL